MHINSLIINYKKEGIYIYCCISSGAIWGIEPYIVRIETDISQGMPYFNMVGLLSSEVKEARERVRTAIKNSGESLPTHRVTINLSPADRRKEGAGFDLPIAISLLCAMGRISIDKVKSILVIGELGLNGEIKRVNGILPIIRMAKKMGYKACVIPMENSREGVLIKGIRVLAFNELKEVIEYFDGNIEDDSKWSVEDNYNKDIGNYDINDVGDFSEIFGQEVIKRALIVSAAGWHNLMMIGSPGVGKSMLASRMPGIMLELSEDERMEISSIHSICGLLKDGGFIRNRPFSAPHHTITTSALVGGGRIPKPGELTIAHRGVLFLDELPEFSPNVLDSLRQPLEEKKIKIHRMSGNYEFPADCLIITAMNPCRCGYYPDMNKCKCSATDVANYLGKVSGPIIDRIDMSVEVPRVKVEDIDNTENNLDSSTMREIVRNAVNIQKNRQGNKYNSQMSVDDIRKFCVLGKEESEFLKEAYTRFGLSMRGYYKVIKVARTIADVEEADNINVNHLAEALGYRVAENDYYKR